MLHSIFEDKYEETLEKVNNVLQYLKETSNGLFELTNDIYLTKNDFA